MAPVSVHGFQNVLAQLFSICTVVGGSFETFVSGRLKVEVLLEDNKMVIN